jgi:uncharacterized protein
MSKRTVVIGASENPDRYAHRATLSLRKYGHEVYPVGLKEGKIGDIRIYGGFPEIKDVDTVTLYVGPRNQPHWNNYILSLKPKRVIFNPGTENYETEGLFEKAGIEVVPACTLVMLAIGDY